MDYTGFAIPKGTKKRKPKGIEGYKRLLWCLWHYYLTIGRDNLNLKLPSMADMDRAYSYSNIDLDHIENVGSHKDLKFDIFNMQLLDRKNHTKKTDSGKYTDYRDVDFIKFLKSIFEEA